VAKVVSSVTIDRPVEAVWEFMTNLSNAPRKDKDVLEARQISPGPFGVGSTAILRYPRQTYSLRVIEYEPSRRFTFEFTSGLLKGTKSSFNFEATDGRTRLTRTDDVRSAGFYRLVGPFVVRRVKKVEESDLANAKRILESGAQS